MLCVKVMMGEKHLQSAGGPTKDEGVPSGAKLRGLKGIRQKKNSMQGKSSISLEMHFP